MSQETAKTQEPAPSWWLLVLPLATLAVIAAFAWLAYQSPMTIGFTIMGAVLGLPFLWMLASAFRPAMPDRRCPACQQEALVTIDPQDETGIRCLACGAIDKAVRIPYLRNLMNDPDIAAEAGFIIDPYGRALLPTDPEARVQK